MAGIKIIQNSEFRIQNLILLLAFIVFLICNSCAPVQQWQREHLSDPIMRSDEDPQRELMDQHLLERREGSSGGRGPSGGGCGC